MSLGHDGKFHPARTLLYGLAMGSADAVPGISGGTIALLLGFYAKLLAAAATVMSAPFLLRAGEGRQELRDAFAFLVPLGTGLLAAYYVATKILVGASDRPGLLRTSDTAPYLYAGFLGLVVASAFKVWTTIPGRSWREGVLIALGAASAWAFVGLPHFQSEPPLWALFPGGAAAIGVMLLPGVSGSLLLVILGQYQAVSGAIHDRDFAVLAVFAAGLGVGVMTVVPLLRQLLRRHLRPTLAVLTGLMLGSMRALWPWKTQYDPKAGILANRWDVFQDGGPSFGGILLAVAVGALTVLALAAVERRHAATVTETA